MWKVIGAWLLANPAPIVITVLVLVLLIVALWKIDTIKTLLPKPKAKKPARSCSDCMMIAYGIWLKHDAEVDKIRDSILDNQMRFAEQKLEDFELFLLQDYKDDQVSFRPKGEVVSPERLKEEYKEYVIYQEALHNSFRLVFKEIRRSCKENGFCELHTERFASYVKNKAKDLLRIARQYLMTVYPQEGMIVPLKHRFQKMDERHVEDMAFEIYINAKTIYNDAHTQMKELEDNFHTDIDRHVGGDEDE
jgi:hypothetical protein